MTDKFPTRVVVVALALVVVGGLGAVVFLASTQTPIPDAMDRLVFTALGSLGTILARPTGGTTPVEVVNDDEAPVPVETQPVAKAAKRG
jgi:hypothetical protein